MRGYSISTMSLHAVLEWLFCALWEGRRNRATSGRLGTPVWLASARWSKSKPR